MGGLQTSYRTVETRKAGLGGRHNVGYYRQLVSSWKPSQNFKYWRMPGCPMSLAQDTGWTWVQAQFGNQKPLTLRLIETFQGRGKLPQPGNAWLAQIRRTRTLSTPGFPSQQLELEQTQITARPGGTVARATCQDWEGKAGTRPLTSGWSLKTLSRKRPRLNSISRAEPLATVTRLRWFRENMLAAPCSVRFVRS